MRKGCEHCYCYDDGYECCYCYFEDEDEDEGSS